MSEKTGLKIVYINVDKPKKAGVVNLRNVSVPHFLTLIKNASYVVTSSFHGIAFSLIYNREVYYQLSMCKDNFNSRVETLIQIAGIQGRDITSTVEIGKNPIEWEKVNTALNEMRKQSEFFLERSVLSPNE